MAVKPVFVKAFLLGNFQGVLIILLHFSDNVDDGGETKVQ